MLYVKTKVLPSKIHGLGLFADEFVPKGTLVWKFLTGFDQHFTRGQIENFPSIVQIYVAKYAALSKQSRLYLLRADSGNYFNHSTEPNCRDECRDGEEDVLAFTVRDIRPGEELTVDYSDFEDLEDGDNILFEIFRKYGLVDEVDPGMKGNRQGRNF